MTTPNTITVPTHNTQRPQLHFRFGNRAEFELGLIKQAMKHAPDEHLHHELEAVYLAHAGICSHNDNQLPEGWNLDDTLDILDYISPENNQKVGKVAMDSMGFTKSLLLLRYQAVANLQQMVEAGTNGKKPNKKG